MHVAPTAHRSVWVLAPPRMVTLAPGQYTGMETRLPDSNNRASLLSLRNNTNSGRVICGRGGNGRRGGLKTRSSWCRFKSGRQHHSSACVEPRRC